MFPTKIKIPKLGKELAEEIGIHIGDGSLGVYPTYHYDYTICGGIDDDIYLLDFVKPLMYKLYRLNKPYIARKKKDDSFVLVYCSKELVLLKKRIGLPVGPKNNITIPKIVMRSNFILDCLRGIFDTDGMLLFKKRHKDVNYYPVIKLCIKSRILIQQIEKILISKNIIPNIQYDVITYDRRGFSSKTSQLHINGKKNVEEFMEKIGFSNIKHITKYLIWKKFGYSQPYTTLEERLKILNA